jgi:hypothetical protein
MKNKIENLSMFLFLGLALFAMVEMLMFVVELFSSLDVQTSTMAFGS